MIIDDKISRWKLQCDIDRERPEISALASRKNW